MPSENYRIRGRVPGFDKSLSSKSQSAPKGIGGWLMVLAVVLVLTPIGLGVTIVTGFSGLVSPGIFSAIIETNPALGWLVIAELVLNLVYFGAFIWLLFPFFRQQRIFVKAFIFLMLTNSAYAWIDAILLHTFFSDIMAGEPFLNKDLIRAIVSPAIWVSYVCVSKRVKNTFVRPEEPQTVDVFA